MRTQSKTHVNALKRGKTRVTKSRFRFSFTSDWLRGWREFSRPITEHSKAKPMQSRITFDTQLKIALNMKCKVVYVTLIPNLRKGQHSYSHYFLIERLMVWLGWGGWHASWNPYPISGSKERSIGQNASRDTICPNQNWGISEWYSPIQVIFPNFQNSSLKYDASLVLKI